MIPNMVYVIVDHRVVDLIPQYIWDTLDITPLYNAYGVNSIDWVTAWYSNKEELLVEKLRR